MNRDFSWHLHIKQGFLSLLHSVSFSSFVFSFFFPWSHSHTTQKGYAYTPTHTQTGHSSWVWHTLEVRTVETVGVCFVFLQEVTVLQELTKTAQSALLNLHILTMSCKTYVIAKPEIHYFTVTQGLGSVLLPAVELCCHWKLTEKDAICSHTKQLILLNDLAKFGRLIFLHLHFSHCFILMVQRVMSVPSSKKSEYVPQASHLQNNFFFKLKKWLSWLKSISLNQLFI